MKIAIIILTILVVLLLLFGVSALMAMNNRVIKSVEGIIDDDVDRSIRNLTDIGRDGMTQTDAMILKIMTSKS